jgi:hypothetical protein
MTFSVTTNSITTLSIMTLSIMTLTIMALSITIIKRDPEHDDTHVMVACHYAECRYAECRGTVLIAVVWANGVSVLVELSLNGSVSVLGPAP